LAVTVTVNRLWKVGYPNRRWVTRTEP